MTAHILIVDDETLIRSSLTYSLQQAGYRTSAAPSAEDALLAQRDRPDLVLLDIGLPGWTAWRLWVISALKSAAR